MSETCRACLSEHLQPHLAVAGALGEAGLIPTTDQFGTALGNIIRCERCGHMQLDVFPAEAELAEAYSDAASGDYVEEEAGERETARRTLALLDRHVPKGRLLDLGCWVGFLLSEARASGWDVLGVEPSRFAAAYARDTNELEIVEDDLFTAPLEPHSFDAVALGDVIEHLPRPGDALDRIAALLRPGGAVVLILPDAGSWIARRLGRRWWSVLPTHVQYFTRSSLTTLLDRHGYEVVQIGTSPKAFSVEYYLGRIAGYSSGVSRLLIRIARALRLADRIWAPDFRDRMIAIAKLREGGSN